MVFSVSSQYLPQRSSLALWRSWWGWWSRERPRQVAGSPASEPAVGGRPPRGAKLPARLPQPHLGQGDGQGHSAGSTVHSPGLASATSLICLRRNLCHLHLIQSHNIHPSNSPFYSIYIFIQWCPLGQTSGAALQRKALMFCSREIKQVACSWNPSLQLNETQHTPCYCRQFCL